ncbi:ExbD/TolR family protein [Sphingomonas quercus]|uniref:Biopolymer transporter ExbD n=1 Tax=Sphingomonas quercus TaxID=2842451 RepID=A0ABS6BIN0_9SPHN|nr:biopolymer transporter ExbD [Sphingomonas quercus]MBU3078166.1 biopolymer transporter ExbD [Sphingomonas quercus]
MAMSAGGAAEGEPMMDINTTPLIDVMLVLLIMFIITIPIQTHAVKLDLPQNNNDQTPPPVDPVKNKITIDPAGIIYWNGTPVDLVTLRQYLDLTKNMNPEPELHLQPDAQARYDTVDRVLSVTKKAQITKMGFVGNEAYGAF